MTGVLLTRLTRALLHEDTFDLMVAPAIADLQFDPSVAGYGAVWLSLAGGFADDFSADLRMVADDAAMLTTLIAIQASYYASMLLLLVTGMSAREAIQTLLTGGSPQLLLAVLIVLMGSALPTLLCFWPSRRVRDIDN